MNVPQQRLPGWLMTLLLCTLYGTAHGAAKMPETPQEQQKLEQDFAEKKRLQQKFTQDRFEQKERQQQESQMLRARLDALKAPHPAQEKTVFAAEESQAEKKADAVWAQLFWVLGLLAAVLGVGYFTYYKLKQTVPSM